MKFFRNNSLVKGIILSNFMSSISILMPILIVPHLMKVLGAGKYGEVLWASTICLYFSLFVDYGFNISATRLISINRENIKKCREIYSSVQLIKVITIIVLFCFLIFSFVIFDIKVDFRFLLFFSFFSVIGNGLYPIWIFQGLESLSEFSILTFIVRFASIIFFYFGVDSNEDGILVPVISGFSSIVLLVLGSILLRRLHDIYFIVPSRIMIRKMIKDGWSFFVSTIFISLYTISIPFLLGFISGPAELAVFSVAEKIIQLVKSLFQPISSALLPHMSRKFSLSYKSSFQLIFQFATVFGIAMLFLGIITIIYSDNIAFFFSQSDKQLLSQTIKIVGLIPLFVVISNLFGIHGLLNIGADNVFRNIISVVALNGLGLSILLIMEYGVIGASYSLFFVELSISIFMFIYFKKFYAKHTNLL